MLRRHRHRGGGIWRGGVPSPIGQGSGEGALPLLRNFFNFLPRNGAFFEHSDQGRRSWGGQGGPDPPENMKGGSGYALTPPENVTYFSFKTVVV